MSIDPEMARIRATIAANTRWSRTSPSERTAATAAARAAAASRWERQVDPDGRLTPEDRTRMAANARAADLARLRLAAVQARKAKHRKGAGAA